MPVLSELHPDTAEHLEEDGFCGCHCSACLDPHQPAEPCTCRFCKCRY